MTIKTEITQYGFNFGSAKVERIASDDKRQWVVVGVETPKDRLHIYVTKTGKIDIHDAAGNRFVKEIK